MILLVIGCSKDSLPDPYERSLLNIKIVSGNNQKGDDTEFLKDSIVFMVTDRLQNPISGKVVDFKIVSGGGVLDDNQKITDTKGLVYIKWRVGSGLDQIFKAVVADDKGATADAWIIANSNVEFIANWISGIKFYMNFTEPLAHDNKILETNNYLIFSDAASDDNKVIFAKIAEEHLKYILDWFEINYQDIGIDPKTKETKIKVYAHTTTTTPGTWRGAKNYGILFHSYASPGWIRSALKHELTHMVELLLIGPENFVGSCPPTWFSEGLAEYFGDFTCTCPYPIDNQTKLNSWISSHKNPITITDFSDIGSTRACEYYTMFGLMVKYFFDSEGLNINCDQVKGMYKNLAVSKSFSLSFEQNMNISLEELEDNIYTWLTNYLPSE